MRDYIVERVLSTAAYILETGATVRACAKRFKISKTTVHKDMRERLPQLRPDEAREVAKVLLFNKADRHIRGGLATRMKYRAEQDS
ncbi:MAG: stage III sporulation protein D [Clostridiales bacterium]|nr:stage III sporulation protein D [Clostridiales bacterium]